MKNFFRLTLLLLITGPGIAFAQEEQPRGQLLDRIVAVVNDDVIMQSELESEADQIRRIIQERGDALPPEDALMRQVLERMINSRLQLQYAKRAGIRVSDDRVNQAMAEVARRNDVNLSELPEVMAQEGVNYAEFRDKIREELLVAEVQRRAIDDRVSVSPREVEEFLERQKQRGEGEEYLVSHILIAVPGRATPEAIEEARVRIEEIRDEIVAGADFARMAATWSDSAQALEGGSLGWRKLSEMPTLFAGVVPDLEKGEVSEPIRSGSGWHLVHVDDVRGRERVMATETHARHILLKPNELRNEAATRALANRLRRRVAEGEAFEELAKEYSEDPGSAAQGGDLGWQPPGTFAPRFQEILDSLRPGDISDPFETQFGIHVAQVLERRETDFTDTVAENRAYQAIKRRKAEEQLPIWVQQQRDSAHIEVRMED